MTRFPQHTDAAGSWCPGSGQPATTAGGPQPRGVLNDLLAAERARPPSEGTTS